MRLTQIVASEGTLLNYAMVTNPDPLGVGSTAILTFVVSAPSLDVQPLPITVGQISFALPVGNPSSPDPTDLTDTPPPASCATISSSGSDVWTIAPGAADGSFIATPPNGTPIEVGSQGLTVMFSGIEVSTLVGTAEIVISEWASTSGAPPPASGDASGTLSIAAPKFPAGFYAGNFYATPPAVQNGQGGTLTWIGSTNGTYMLYSGISAPVNVSGVRSCSTGVLTDVTSFVLEASAQEGGQTVSLYFTTTVTVIDPSIVANSLQVQTTSQLTGAVTAASSLAVAGTSTLSGGVTVTAGATVAGGLAVTGGLTSDNATVSGALTANGQVTAGSLSAGTTSLGATTVNGLNAGQGPVAALGGIQSISPGAWTAPNAFLAPTDGFVFGIIQGPPSYNSGGCMCYAYIQTQGVSVFGTGGNVGFFGPSWDDCMANNFTSLMMPVAANNYFYLGLSQGGGDCQQTDATYAFYFMPLGSGSVGATAVQVEDAPEAEQPKPVEPPSVGDKMRRDWAAPEQFVTVLETLLPEPIDAATKAQLIEVLHRM